MTRREARERTGVLVSTTDVTKSYGKGDARFRALRGVTMTVEAGETVAIVGRSGSGKSTLMHILGLLDTPESGSLQVAGRDVAKLKERERDLLRNSTFGFIFQQFYLNPTETVAENAVTPLKIAGVRRRDRAHVAQRILEQVGLADKAKNRATALSGGQKQRVAIARALSNDPAVIFADEPTGNLDSENGRTIEDLLFTLNEEHGVALVIVTHDPALAARCSRRLTVRDGRIVAPGSPSEAEAL